MPIFEEILTIELPRLEALASLERGPAYPYPPLRATSAVESVDLRVLVLENRYLRVTVAPELGGRLLQIIDLRSGRASLSPPRVESGGKRGVRLIGGIELSLDGEERLDATGPVDVHWLEEESGEAAAILGSLAAGVGISWHIRLSLPPDRAAIRIDAKVLNRLLQPVPYRAGLLLEPLAPVVIGAEAGVFEGGPFRSAALATLAPRQVDSWSCEIAPTDLPNPVLAGDAIVALESGALRISSVQSLPSAKVMLASAGKAFETRADLDPKAPIEFDLSGFAGVDEVAIMDSDGRERLRWSLAGDLSADGLLRRQLLHADSRGAANVGLALHALHRGDQARAAGYLDDALATNGEDHLVWWLKAALARNAGERSDDAQELLNAHFLAPLEPLLRAESFLSADALTHEPNPLVQSVAEDPDAAAEVAVQLLDAGLLEDLARWVDECLRHRDAPMLRYLLAFALLTNSRMVAEAAQHVALAGKAPVTPPYPWRDTEILALKSLAGAFPNDARLAELNALIG